MAYRLSGLVAGAVLSLLAASAQAESFTTLQFLSPDDTQPARLLPPPPADGTPEAAAELDELHRLAATASQERWDQAQWDSENENGSIFQSAIAPGFDLSALPATARLLADVRNDEAIAAAKAKVYFNRARPWIVDPALKTCSRDEAPQSSYPSGHATMAYSMAVVLAEAMPDAAPQIMVRARDYAESRLICGMHFRSDIVGGQALGTAVAERLLSNPRFRQDLLAAEAELQSKGLTAPRN